MTVKPKPAGMPDLSSLGVIIPYPVLVELLQAPTEMVELRAQVKNLQSQIAALRNMFTELMELYNSYQD